MFLPAKGGQRAGGWEGVILRAAPQWVGTLGIPCRTHGVEKFGKPRRTHGRKVYYGTAGYANTFFRNCPV